MIASMHVVSSLGGIADVHADVTKPGQPYGQLGRVTDGSPIRQDDTTGCHGLISFVDPLTCSSPCLEESSSLVRWKQIGIFDCSPQQDRSFPGGAQRGAPGSGPGSEVQHRNRVVGRQSVMGSASKVTIVPQRLQSPGVKLPPTCRRDRFLDGEAGQVVTKPQLSVVIVEKPSRHTLVEASRRSPGHGRDQVDVSDVSQNGSSIEGVTGVRGQRLGAAQDGVTNRRREDVTLSGQNLSHEERVASGGGMKHFWIHPSVTCHRSDGIA